MTASKVAVKIGPIINSHIAILSELETSTTIITDGSPYLSDGSVVKVVE